MYIWKMFNLEIPITFSALTKLIKSIVTSSLKNASFPVYVVRFYLYSLLFKVKPNNISLELRLINKFSSKT